MLSDKVEDLLFQDLVFQTIRFNVIFNRHSGGLLELFFSHVVAFEDLFVEVILISTFDFDVFLFRYGMI